jgi:hypothetical protein
MSGWCFALAQHSLSHGPVSITLPVVTYRHVHHALWHGAKYPGDHHNDVC